MLRLQTSRKWVQFLLRGLWVAVLLLSAAGCNRPDTPKPVTKVVPSWTHTLTLSRTPTPTLTPTRTLTPTSTPTLTPTPTENLLGSIEGIIYNSLSGTTFPAVDAEVRISEKPDILSTSDSSGAFQLEGIEPYLYHLRASNIVGSSVEKLVPVVVGQVSHVEIIISQPLMIQYLYISAIVTCNGIPAAGALVWVAGTNMDFTANDMGKVVMNNLPKENAAVVIVANPCSAIIQPQEGLNWKITLMTAKRLYRLPPNRVTLPPNIKLEYLQPLPLFIPTRTATVTAEP